ncbi:hypothetical protein IscW_ISCW012344 [Ixodes scapularis]|uniref:Uncharacterized protein n=1 Tax=Ixodes scapularis TaxID=6945 RepID=B7QCS8_IXOSC|nr:hypothetical protein IscW_ISCW012344 [Ixodes scapularis]|eukprot:XP_002413342.1 hypothetical protein IscW_ISCW012344 [Ixodes scapularis]
MYVCAGGGVVEYEEHTGGGSSGHHHGPLTEYEDSQPGESGQAGPPSRPGLMCGSSIKPIIEFSLEAILCQECQDLREPPLQAAKCTGYNPERPRCWLWRQCHLLLIEEYLQQGAYICSNKVMHENTLH